MLSPASSKSLMPEICWFSVKNWQTHLNPRLRDVMSLYCAQLRLALTKGGDAFSSLLSFSQLFPCFFFVLFIASFHTIPSSRAPQALKPLMKGYHKPEPCGNGDAPSTKVR